MQTKLSTQKKLLITACAAGVLMMGGCSDGKNKTVAPPASTNLYSINASGGIGGSDGGTGGDADFFQVEKYNFGDIVITNKVDVSESTPTKEYEEPVVSIIDYSAFTPRNLTGLGSAGAVPMMVTADTDLSTVLTTGDAKPAAGTFYQVLGNSNIFVSDGSTITTVPTDDDVVTGINIASGATLTLGLNLTGPNRTVVNLVNDLVNHGVLTKAEDSATVRGDLFLNIASYIATGDINNQGTQDAQDGGRVYISANYSVFNQGNINSSGANSAAAATDAGDGDVIEFAAEIIENTGNLTAIGGSASDGAGGNAGSYIGLYANWGNAFTSGTLDIHGGTGTTGGGDGGYIEVYAESTGDMGEMKVSGTLSTYGGDASGGDAGNADYVYFYPEGADISSSATINAYGGSTTDAAGNGGDGGYYEIYSEGDDPFNNADDVVAPGDVRVTGNINTSGGNAVATGTGNGGNAGYVYTYSYSDDQPEIESIVKFMGYSGINVSGGNGNNGGDGDSFELYAYHEFSGSDVYFARSSVYNDLPIDATGGDVVATDPAVAASAGRGGSVNLETPYYQGALSPDSFMVVNSGNIDASAGSGSINNPNTSTSRGGSVYMWGYNGVENTGNLSTNGGSDVATDGGTDGFGGSARDVEMYSDRGAVDNSGNIAINGGNGEYQGGNSDGAYMYGASVINTGNISANGGNATATLAGSEGGNGGYIELHSPDYTQSSNSGTVSHTGGTGETAGDDGALVVAGLCTGGGC